MRIVRAIAGALALLALGSAANAAERLVLGPYPGMTWHDVVNQTNGVHFFREQMPDGQTQANFQDLMTSQAVTNFRGAPAQFLAATMTQLGQSCDNVETVGPTIAVEDGHTVAYGRLYCGHQKGQPNGAHIFFKVIRGNDALYVVDRDFKIPPSEHPSAPTLPEAQAIPFLQAEGAARKYLTEQVFICDPVFPEPRCSGEAVPTGR